MKVSELFQNEPKLTVLVYGDSGTGKTTWAAQAPRPLILLTEKHGLPSVNVANPDADVGVITSWKRVKSEVSRLKKAEVVEVDGQKAIKIKSADGSELIIQTLVLDSLTYVSELCRRHHTKSKVDQTTLQEWGFIKRSISRLLAGLRDLKCNVICICLSTDIAGGEGERTRTLPLMNPSSLRHEIAQYFSAVGVTMKLQGGYVIWWSLGQKYITKRPPTRNEFPPATSAEIDTGVGTLGSILRALYPDVPGVAFADQDDATKLTTKESK